METAINVAMACDLLNASYSVHQVTLPDAAYLPPDEANRDGRIAQQHLEREMEVRQSQCPPPPTLFH